MIRAWWHRLRGQRRTVGTITVEIQADLRKWNAAFAQMEHIKHRTTPVDGCPLCVLKELEGR